MNGDRYFRLAALADIEESELRKDPLPDLHALNLHVETSRDESTQKREAVGLEREVPRLIRIRGPAELPRDRKPVIVVRVRSVFPVEVVENEAGREDAVENFVQITSGILVHLLRREVEHARTDLHVDEAALVARSVTHNRGDFDVVAEAQVD